MSHYHIRWSSQNELDWERFDSYAEALASAKQLAREGETYIIEERDQVCARCRVAYISKTGREPQETNSKVEELTFKYPWQKSVLDAFAEMQPELLQFKVNKAQRAIAARLRDLASADLDEQIALRDALHRQVLLPKPVKPRSDEKKASA